MQTKATVGHMTPPHVLIFISTFQTQKVFFLFCFFFVVVVCALQPPQDLMIDTVESVGDIEIYIYIFLYKQSFFLSR